MATWIYAGQRGTRRTLIQLSTVYCGSPFCFVPASGAIDLKIMDYVYCAAPFVAYAKG